jgi:hypothetical protein
MRRLVTQVYKGIEMGFYWSYWIVAWVFMALTFLIATGAILMGAFALDKENQYPDDGDH